MKDEALKAVQEPVAEDVVEAYCKAWGESFSQANKFDVVSPISDDLKKHIRAGLEAAFAATHQQGLQVATPPAAQRQWVGLNDEEISDIAINNPPMVHEFARAIEAKLKEKNT
jgi:hypothetical protein